MYLVCKHCQTDDIEVTSPYDSHPFYCNKCRKMLGFEEVKEYYTIATHYSNTQYKSILVFENEK